MSERAPDPERFERAADLAWGVACGLGWIAAGLVAVLVLVKLLDLILVWPQ